MGVSRFLSMVWYCSLRARWRTVGGKGGANQGVTTPRGGPMKSPLLPSAPLPLDPALLRFPLLWSLVAREPRWWRTSVSDGCGDMIDPFNLGKHERYGRKEITTPLANQRRRPCCLGSEASRCAAFMLLSASLHVHARWCNLQLATCIDVDIASQNILTHPPRIHLHTHTSLWSLPKTL